MLVLAGAVRSLSESSPGWRCGRRNHEDRGLENAEWFERYAIVSQSDIRDAMTKLKAGQQRERAEAIDELVSAQEQFGQNRIPTLCLSQRLLLSSRGGQ